MSVRPSPAGLCVLPAGSPPAPSPPCLTLPGPPAVCAPASPSQDAFGIYGNVWISQRFTEREQESEEPRAGRGSLLPCRRQRTCIPAGSSLRGREDVAAAGSWLRSRGFSVIALGSRGEPVLPGCRVCGSAASRPVGDRDSAQAARHWARRAAGAGSTRASVQVGTLEQSRAGLLVEGRGVR